ncbi:MAG: ferrochelatase [Saprospiraceae bacterium]|nr:ferrochelatase [Saprospiraceae bacterium]
MIAEKMGLLLINLGTPNSPKRKDVTRYLNEFLTDGRVIDLPWLRRQLLVRGIIVPFRSGNSTKLYQQLWTEKGSPLKYYGEQLKEKLQKQVPEHCTVELAMRYQHPSIEEGLKNLLALGVDRLIIFPLFPHYASASTGSAHEEVLRILRKREVIPALSLVQDYYDHPRFIDGFIQNAKEFDIDTYDHIVFSYHGLPQSQLEKADSNKHCLQTPDCCRTLGAHNRNCYSAQCYATSAALAERLQLTADRHTTCFQSRLGRAEWTHPYTSKILKSRAEKGEQRLLVFCPAFVADCLETTIEIGDEYKAEFLEAGGKTLDLVPSLNDAEHWVQAIREIINDRTALEL